MRLLRNRGSDRAVDQLRSARGNIEQVAIASSRVSAWGLDALRTETGRQPAARLILPPVEQIEPGLLGTAFDRPFRNNLNARRVGLRIADFLRPAEIRLAPGGLPQSTLQFSGAGSAIALVGGCDLTTSGLGLTPSTQFSLLQLAESPEERAALAEWFEEQWRALGSSADGRTAVLAALENLGRKRSASEIHHRILDALFSEIGEDLDENRIVKTATGIRDTVVWSKLYKFQRDGVIGAIDKLQRFGGCILADSVGLGKTFEALAVIKYHELRNDRVLVLCPKRLRDNWTLPKANDRRNVLASDRFAYDVLNHTDLSREEGLSGDIDLAHVNWGNYDLVVIDESHNFRNNFAHRDKVTRYDRLMNQVFKAGVKTRVLMLSATPVNNRLADLKNQIAFATEGNDHALREHGVTSIERTIRVAEGQFTRWSGLPEERRSSDRLLDMLGFDYFRLLDLLTIARSRKHIERYYGTSETGRFPERLPPRNIKAKVDLAEAFPPISTINDDIRRLNLAAYAPLSYVLPSKQAAYDERYSQTVRGGKGVFRQADRERSMIHLLRVNLLKRMESSVVSFALTVERQLATVDALIDRIDAHADDAEEPGIDDLELDDPMFEQLSVGRAVKVLLADTDRVRWRQDLVEDRERLSDLLEQAREVTPDRDAKLKELRELILAKRAEPFNPGNRKVLVFTAFSDTAQYLYRELSGLPGVNAALVAGTGANKTNVRGLRTDLASILTAFSPRSKGRPADLADEGEIDLLIATDVISEGQNLQDCDCLVNYDIHWNPVRIVQRFGRIDRLGSPNSSIQLINFWPDMELDAYIGLEQRVSGRMKLLDVSATGEENIIEQASGDTMNDLDYRRRQLQTLQTTVIDLDDLSSGVSIADLTLNDLRMDLARIGDKARAELSRMPLTAHAAVWASDEVPAGAIFCLRAETPAALNALAAGDPIRPHALVHVSDRGATLLGTAQAKRVLDRTKWLADRGQEPDLAAWEALDRQTNGGANMNEWREMLSEAIASLTGRADERAIDSLFSPGAVADFSGGAGLEDWEVIAWFAVIPKPDAHA